MQPYSNLSHICQVLPVNKRSNIHAIMVKKKIERDILAQTLQDEKFSGVPEFTELTQSRTYST